MRGKHIWDYQILSRVRRTKSLRDIENQLYRIMDSGASMERVARAQRVYERYWESMSKTKSFQKDNYEMQKAFASGNAREYNRRDDILMDRQYSRNTYMGLNNG